MYQTCNMRIKGKRINYHASLLAIFCLLSEPLYSGRTSVTVCVLVLLFRIFFFCYSHHILQRGEGECIGSVVECLSRDQGVEGSNLRGVTTLCPFKQDTLIFAQRRKTHHDINEKLLNGM